MVTLAQGCESSFSKELSSQFKFLGQQELLFSSSSSRWMHELSYSSVQFYLFVWVTAIYLKAVKEEKGTKRSFMFCKRLLTTYQV